jgi:CRP/FNR family transcriptional regulator
METESLKKQILFKDIDDDNLKKIAQKLKAFSFKKGAQIFNEKEDAKGIYLIQSGRVQITKTTPDGWKQTLAVLGEGHFCGELSILEQRQHEANASAIEDTTLLLLAKEDFEQIEKDSNQLANLILKKLAFALSKNLRRMNEKFIEVLINY